MVRGKKRIVIDSFALFQATTGVKTFILEMCQGLEEYGDNALYDFRVIPDYQRLQTNVFFKGSNQPKWKRYLHHVVTFLWKQLVVPAYALISRADLLVCPDFVAPRFTFGVRKLVIIHDAFLWQHPELYGKFWRRYTIFQIMQGLKGKSVIGTTSEYSKVCLSRYLQKSLPVHVLYQSAGLNMSTACTNEELPYQLKSRNYILHVGFFDKRKNLAVLVQAFKIFNNNKKGRYKLVLAGDRATSRIMDDFDDIKNLSHELGIAEDILMPGYISPDILSLLYREALMYVFPSQNEGFGIPVIEAMNYGLPVIVSKSGALKEIGGSAVIDFDTNDYEGLAGKMLELESNPELRNRMIQAGNRRVQLFTRQAFISRFIQLVNQTLENNGNG